MKKRKPPSRCDPRKAGSLQPISRFTHRAVISAERRDTTLMRLGRTIRSCLRVTICFARRIWKVSRTQIVRTLEVAPPRYRFKNTVFLRANYRTELGGVCQLFGQVLVRVTDGRIRHEAAGRPEHGEPRGKDGPAAAQMVAGDRISRNCPAFFSCFLLLFWQAPRQRLPDRRRDGRQRYD